MLIVYICRSAHVAGGCTSAAIVEGVIAVALSVFRAICVSGA